MSVQNGSSGVGWKRLLSLHLMPSKVMLIFAMKLPRMMTILSTGSKVSTLVMNACQRVVSLPAAERRASLAFE